MMKHVIIAFIILALVTAGALLCIQYTKVVSEQLLDTLDLCEESVARGDWEAAQENIYLTGALWEKHRPRLASFLMHNDLNDISDLLIQVTALVALRDQDRFFIENRRLSAMVDEISRMNSLTFENLF